MSLRAIPLILFVFILYNVIVLLGGQFGFPPAENGGSNADAILRYVVLPIPMLNGHVWTFTWGDLIVLLLFAMLFVELLKATYTSGASLLDHGLSMLVFVVCLIEFLMVRQAQTSVFFFITIATLIDVIAGYTIGIRVARRDLAIGG
ncbi:MAG: hypothetical protein KKB37_06900 [Alphaproteobacteria bacterium]|nr:hypothetical protein [Alphaproteobacteria bacterium]